MYLINTQYYKPWRKGSLHLEKGWHSCPSPGALHTGLTVVPRETPHLAQLWLAWHCKALGFILSTASKAKGGRRGGGEGKEGGGRKGRKGIQKSAF